MDARDVAAVAECVTRVAIADKTRGVPLASFD